jgi:hypothetical protein
MGLNIRDIVLFNFTRNLQRFFIVSISKRGLSTFRRIVRTVFSVYFPDPCIQPQRLPIDIQVPFIGSCGKLVILCTRNLRIIQRIHGQCRQ